MEVCRQDPDHTNGPIVNLPRTADNGRSPPKRRFHSPWLRMMTSLRPGKASSGDEHAPELGWNAEHEEEVGTDALAAQHLGAAVARHRLPPHRCTEQCSRSCGCALGRRARCQRDLIQAGSGDIFFGQRYESIRCIIGKLFQPNRVHHTKNRRVRADPEGDVARLMAAIKIHTPSSWNPSTGRQRSASGMVLPLGVSCQLRPVEVDLRAVRPSHTVRPRH